MKGISERDNAVAGLTEKQKRFCEEYLIDLNATQAAIRAGYSEATAYSQGQRLLKNVEVQALLSERKKKLQESTEITQERVLKEYARLAFSDLRQYYDEDGKLKHPRDMSHDSAAALASIEIYDDMMTVGGERVKVGETKKIKLHNKVQALQDLAKHLGLFEVDNKQKQPQIDLDSLPDEVIKALLNAGRS